MMLTENLKSIEKLCTFYNVGEVTDFSYWPLKSNFKWTKEAIVAEAKKYNTRSEFKKNSGTAYKLALNLYDIEKICNHMPKNSRLIKWTKETVMLEAKKYKTRYAFSLGNGTAYRVARKLKILDLVCEHMPKNASVKWNIETIMNEIKKYDTMSKFSAGSGGAYVAAERLEILPLVHKQFNKNKN